jgi:hypothetical protein
MTIVSEEPRVRPRAGWYAVPVVLWIVAAILLGLALAALSHIINSGIDPVRNQGTLSVPDDGLTVYTTDPDSTASCTLTGGGERVELETFSFDLDINVNGPTYHGIGVTPETLPAGTYRLVCTDVSPGSRLGTGPRIDVTAIATRAVWGFVLPPVLGITGLVVLIVLVVRRHSSKAQIRSMQAYAGIGSGYGAAWNQQYRPGPSGSEPSGSEPSGSGPSGSAPSSSGNSGSPPPPPPSSPPPPPPPPQRS